MSYSDSFPIDAGVDLRGVQHRVLTIGGTLAIENGDARGIQQARVDSGEQVGLLYQGRGKFVAGGAIAAGGRLKVSSGGFCVAATSGDTACGFNENAAVSSGAVGHGVFNFANMTLTTSNV